MVIVYQPRQLICSGLGWANGIALNLGSYFDTRNGLRFHHPRIPCLQAWGVSNEDCKQGIIDQGIQQGWIRYGKCNYWDDSYTGRSGFEVQIDNDNLHFKKDWDPVWIVRIGDWY